MTDLGSQTSNYNYPPNIDDHGAEQQQQIPAQVQPQLQEPFLQGNIIPNNFSPSPYDRERMPRIPLQIQCPQCKNNILTVITQNNLCPSKQGTCCYTGFCVVTCCCFPPKALCLQINVHNVTLLQENLNEYLYDQSPFLLIINKIMKAILILGLLVFGITAVELESGVPILLKEIKAIKTEHTEFTFLLDLELSQGGKVSEVVALVGDLLEQMKRDQLNDDLEYAHRTTTLGLDIEWLLIVLRGLTKERSDKNNQLAEVNQVLVGLQLQLAAITEQLSILNGKEEQLRNTRAQEAASYQARQENNSKVLDALNLIIPKLQVAVFDKEGNSLLQTEQFDIVESIKRELGHSHPIAIMVALTTKFDVPTVKRIIDKLEHIRNAVIELMKAEDQQETQSQINFQTAIQEIAELREKFSKDFEVVSQLIKKRTNDKVLLEKRLTIINRDLSLTEQLLIQTREYKEQYDAAYAVRKGKRISEIKTVQQAYDLVDNHAKKHK